MSIIKKPDYTIFASEAKNGELTAFPNLLRGWGVTIDQTAGKPPMEWFNALQKRTDEWLTYLSQRGISEWDNTLDYPQNAVVQFGDNIYVSTEENRGQQPDRSQLIWKEMVDFLGVSKTIEDLKKEAEGKLAKDQNGADIPDPVIFLENIGLGSLQSSPTDKSGKVALNGAWGLGIRNEKLNGTMGELDVSRFDYFAPKDKIGPLPGQWCGGFTHAMGDQIGWQIAGLGLGAAGGSPRAFIRMMLPNNTFSNWGEIYHTLNKPSAGDVGALPVNGKAASASTADAATRLSTARKIAGVAFDGTGDISLGPGNVGAVSSGGGDYNQTFRLGAVGTLGNESNPVQLISAAAGQATDNFVAWSSYTWYNDYVRTGIVRAGDKTIKSFAVEINGVRFLEIGRDGTLLNGNMASDIRLGQQEYMNVSIPGSGQSTDSVVPSGCYVTGVTSTSTGAYVGITRIFFRRLQKRVGGNWVDASWL